MAEKEQRAKPAAPQEGIRWVSSALLVSAVLAIVFFQHILVVAQDVRQSDILGSPNSFAGWPSALLAVYVFFAGKRLRYKFAAVIILTVLLAGTLFWLFGLTSAGDRLGNFSL